MLTPKHIWTLTAKAIDLIDTGSTILTHVWSAVVCVNLTVYALKSHITGTRIVINAIYTDTTLTGIGHAFVNIYFTVSTFVPIWTFTQEVK